MQFPVNENALFTSYKVVCPLKEIDVNFFWITGAVTSIINSIETLGFSTDVRVNIASCCNPLPGDEIVGYITKGRGVSVHRKDCTNINDLISEDNRLIDVEWAQNAKTTYRVEVEVYANDRDGLLIDMIKKQVI